MINVIQGDAPSIVSRVVAHPDFGGLHFTGSTRVLQSIYAKIGENIGRYKSFPRARGRKRRKDFVIAHASADVTALAVALLRGAFEFQGQKCSAASRAYVPRSLWPKVRAELCEMVAGIKVGDPTDFSCFMGAVIGRERVRIASVAVKRERSPIRHVASLPAALRAMRKGTSSNRR